MKPATSEIKPCPYCGAHEDSWTDVGQSSYTDKWQTVCLRCGARGPWADSRDEAIELWNRRVGDQK